MALNGTWFRLIAGLLLVASFSLFYSCTDDGFDGSVLPVEIFLDEAGCLAQEPQTLTVRVGFGVEQLEATLEVFRGAADLVLGWGEAPSSYFSVGRGPGTQKLRVGPDSHFPVLPGTLSLRVGGAASAAAAGCDPSNPADNPDWRVVLRRTPSPVGMVLLSESCDLPDCTVPACDAYPCTFRAIELGVPEDAVSMEVVLNSIAGDADLLVVSDTGVQLGASTNPGSGYDIVILGQDVVVPLQGQTIFVRLTSWAQPTEEYALQATYRPGS